MDSSDKYQQFVLLYIPSVYFRACASKKNDHKDTLFIQYAIFFFDRFTQDRKNHVLIKYKDWSTDKEWKPSPHEDQIELFHQNQNGESILPSGVPEEVEPSIGRKQDLEKIEENIKNLKPFLNFKQHSWWESFFEDHLKVSGYQPQQEWYLKSLQNEVPATPNCLPTAGTTSSPLAIFMNKERSSKQVIIFSKNAKTTNVSE